MALSFGLRVWLESAEVFKHSLIGFIHLHYNFIEILNNKPNSDHPTISDFLYQLPEILVTATSYSSEEFSFFSNFEINDSIRFLSVYNFTPIVICSPGLIGFKNLISKFLKL